MNSEGFNGLAKISKVWLYSNPCIDKHFLEEMEISSMPQIVAENCGICRNLGNPSNCLLFRRIYEFESENSIALKEMFQEKIEKLEEKTAKLEVSLEDQANDEKDCKKSLETKIYDIIDNLKTIARLEYEANTANILKTRCEHNQNTIEEICRKSINESENQKLREVNDTSRLENSNTEIIKLKSLIKDKNALIEFQKRQIDELEKGLQT